MRFTPGGIRTGAAGYDVVFIHPKSKPDAGLPYSGQGVLIELVQAPPEVIAKSKKEWTKQSHLIVKPVVT